MLLGQIEVCEKYDLGGFCHNGITSKVVPGVHLPQDQWQLDILQIRH